MGYDKLWTSLDDALNEEDVAKVKAALTAFTPFIEAAQPANQIDYRAYFGAIATRALAPMWEARISGDRAAVTEALFVARRKIVSDIGVLAITETGKRGAHQRPLGEMLLFLATMRSRTLTAMPFNSDLSACLFGVEYYNKGERFFVPIANTGDKKGYLYLVPELVFDDARQNVGDVSWHESLNRLPLEQKQRRLMAFIWQGMQADANKTRIDPRFQPMIAKATAIVEGWVSGFHRKVVMRS